MEKESILCIQYPEIGSVPYGKKINVILPEQTLQSLSYHNHFTIARIGYYQEPTNHYIDRVD